MNRRTSAVVPLALAASLLLALAPEARAEEPECEVVLWAGQNEDVGTVTVTEDDYGNVTLTYTVDAEGWWLTETHWYVNDECPSKLAPGKFSYSSEDIFDTSDSFTVSLADYDAESWDELCLAAHAVVEEYVDCDEDYEGALPATVSIELAPATDSYWDVTIFDGADGEGTSNAYLDGTFEGWCADADTGIGAYVTHTADVYAASDEGGWAFLVYPENLDLVAWILNQDYPSQTTDCSGTIATSSYTRGDVQMAIWQLLDDSTATVSYRQCRVDEILGAAWANGEGFEPDCGEDAAVLLVPWVGETLLQPILTRVPITCDECESETAWGEFDTAVDQSWGWYGTCPVADVGED